MDRVRRGAGVRCASKEARARAALAIHNCLEEDTTVGYNVVHMSSSSPFSIRLDPALKKRLCAAAKKDDRTVTSFVVHALRRILMDPEEESSIHREEVLIEVTDLEKGGAHLIVNGFAVASWPSPKGISPKAYAEEAARVLRLAIR